MFTKLLLAFSLVVHISATPKDPISALLAKTARVYYQSQTFGQLLAASTLDPATRQFLKDKARGLDSTRLPKMLVQGSALTWPDQHMTIDFADLDKGEFKVNQRTVLCTPVTPDATCYDRVKESLSSPRKALFSPFGQQAYAQGWEVGVGIAVVLGLIAILTMKATAQMHEKEAAPDCAQQVQEMTTLLAQAHLTLISGCPPGQRLLRVTRAGESGSHILEPLERGLRDVFFAPNGQNDTTTELTYTDGRVTGMLRRELPRESHEFKYTQLSSKDPKDAAMLEQQQKDEASVYAITSYVGKNLTCRKCSHELLLSLKGKPPAADASGNAAVKPSSQ